LQRALLLLPVQARTMKRKEFIINFTSKKDKDKFISQSKKIASIYEVYTPNWDIRKD